MRTLALAALLVLPALAARADLEYDAYDILTGEVLASGDLAAGERIAVIRDGAYVLW